MAVVVQRGIGDGDAVQILTFGPEQRFGVFLKDILQRSGWVTPRI
jgi:hypothetical protein